MWSATPLQPQPPLAPMLAQQGLPFSPTPHQTSFDSHKASQRKNLLMKLHLHTHATKLHSRKEPSYQIPTLATSHKVTSIHASLIAHKEKQHTVAIIVAPHINAHQLDTPYSPTLNKYKTPTLAKSHKVLNIYNSLIAHKEKCHTTTITASPFINARQLGILYSPTPH